jgi:phosphatidylserine/phosphatidylglycerophosphate/cardiolipin synthase-like enzyme
VRSSPPVKTPSQKVFLSLLIGGILVFYTWLVLVGSQTDLPSCERPLQFYSNQTRQDIKLVYYHALKQAHQSIFVSVYGITDPDILAVIIQKTNQHLPISVEYDPSASSSLKKILPQSVHIDPIKGKGLMHRKIVIIDHSQVFLGSANLTPTSLRHHDNLVLGLYHPKLAAFLEHPTQTSFAFSLNAQQGELFLFPDPQQTGLHRLLTALHAAKSKIAIAMFTMTHPQIAEALIQAKKRGISISIAADYYAAKGASRKMLKNLAAEGIQILNSQGRQLLHHKWALIDDELLVMGSANWTQAAFSKNHDFLLFLFPLSKSQKQFMSKLWDIIEIESPPLET